MRLSIIIPCYNESDTIERVVARVQQAELPLSLQRDIIIVDDGSDTSTHDALQRIAGVHGDAVRIVFRPVNGGKGAAVKDGLRHARGDYIIIQDADLEYSPEEYHVLLTSLGEAGSTSVFGSRALGRNNVPYNAIYFYGGLLVTTIYNFLFWTKLTDIASCYKLFSRSHIQQLLASDHDDFVFDAVDLTHTLVKNSTIVEVPISYTARDKKTGKKLNWKHGIDIVLAIFLIRIGVPEHRRVAAAKIMRFLIAGGIATVINLALLYILAEYVGLWYVLAVGVSFACAFAVSFVLQKYWAFRNTDAVKVKTQLPAHLSIALCNMFFDMALVYGAVEYLGMWYLIAQVIASAIISIESYFAFRWIYR